eukprot:symbB.v1.2.024521.t1/scaffold2324.1/size158529/9
MAQHDQLEGNCSGLSLVLGMSNASAALPVTTGIWHLPLRGVAVFRESPVHAPAWCSKLKEELQRYQFGTVRFENIDVSNVIWSEATRLSAVGLGTHSCSCEIWQGHLTELFATLRSAGATSQRIKAFRCGAKDSSVLSLCEWLACHDATKLPQEIHLSHNELTTGCLEALITVLEVKSMRHKPSYPYWLRIEGNRMSPSFINELAQEGKACLATGKCSIRSCELMQQGQQPRLLHLRFGANQQKVQPAPQVVFPPVPSSMSGVAPQDGSAAAAAFSAAEARSPLQEKIESAHAMMKELRVDAPAPSASHEKPAQAVQVQAACAEPMRALAEHAAQCAQEELLEAAVLANNEAKAAWEVKNPPEGTTDADMQWQNMQASMQQQQQQQQWQQWQAQQMQQQQMQAQQMQAQMLQAQQMQWQAEQQQLQQQQMQAQWNQAHWNQYLQQAQQPQPAQAQNESGVPQQESLDSQLLRELKKHTQGQEADTVSPKKQEGKDLPSESADANRHDEGASTWFETVRTSNKSKAMKAAAEIEARVKDDKKEEIARPKPSSKYDKGEEKQEKAAEKLEKEPEAKKETKASKDLKEATLNEPKSGTDSKTAEKAAKAKSSSERKEDVGAAPPPWRMNRRIRKGSRSRSPRRRRTKRSPSHRRRRNPRSPSRRRLTRSPSAPAALKKKPPGANPKKKAEPKDAAAKKEPILIEEDKSAEEAKEKELQEKRERAAQVASLKSDISALFGGLM